MSMASISQSCRHALCEPFNALPFVGIAVRTRSAETMLMLVAADSISRERCGMIGSEADRLVQPALKVVSATWPRPKRYRLTSLVGWSIPSQEFS